MDDKIRGQEAEERMRGGGEERKGREEEDRTRGQTSGPSAGQTG